MSIFSKNNDVKESKEYKELLDKIDVMGKASTEMYKNYEREKKILNEEHEREISHLKKDFEIASRRLESKTDVLIAEKTKELTTSLAEKTQEASNYKKECEILNKAFENLGFDVKDMKDILNKLVDGIVSKNQINLVK